MIKHIIQEIKQENDIEKESIHKIKEEINENKKIEEINEKKRN